MEPIVYYTPFRSNIIRKKKPDLDEISESVETRDSTIHFSVGNWRGKRREKGEEDWRVGEETYRSCRHRRGVGSCVPRVITGFPVVTHQRWRIPLNPAGLQAFGRPFGRRHGHGVSRHTGGFNAN